MSSSREFHALPFRQEGTKKMYGWIFLICLPIFLLWIGCQYWRASRRQRAISELRTLRGILDSGLRNRLNPDHAQALRGDGLSQVRDVTDFLNAVSTLLELGERGQLGIDDQLYTVIIRARKKLLPRLSQVV